MAFVDQVQDLTSLSASDTDELSQFLKDGVIDVTSRWLAVRPQDSDLFGRETAISDSQGVSVGGARIIHVMREAGADGSSDGSSAWEPCRKIPMSMQSRVVDSDSLSYASAYNPVYTINSNKAINVYPVPSSNNGFQVFYVNEEPRDITNNAALIHSHSDIKYFPNDKVYLVVMYAGIRLLNATMGSSVISVTSVPPDVPSLATVSFSESNALSISATSPTAISLTTVNYSAASATASTVLSSLTAPIYVKPIQSTQVAFADYWTVGDFGDSDPGALSIAAVVPLVPTISSQVISDPSSYAPTYTKPITTLSATPTISDLSITAVPPDTPSAPSVAGVTIATVSKGSLATSAPAYTKPGHPTQVAFSGYTSGLSETDPGVLAITAVSPVVPTLSATAVSFTGTSAPTYTKPSVAPDFAQVNTYIDTNEDVELASAKLQEISTQLNEYSTDIQNEQAEFNKESVEYQAQLQISIQNAQFDNEEDARKLQKYQAEVATYQADINKEIQQYGQKLQHYSTELNTAYTAWAKTESDNIQVFQADIQNELNDFNKDNAAYQADIQLVIAKFNADVQDAQKEGDLTFQADVQNEQLTLQRYSQELQQYQAEVNTEVQEYQQNLAGDIQVWQAERQTDLQKYGNDIQNELNEFNKENVKYQAILQEHIQEAQLLDAHEARKLQKYQAEVQTYQSDVNKQVQEYTQRLSRYQLELGTVQQSWAKTESDNLQVYQTDIQNELNAFNKENVAFQYEAQKALADAQATNQIAMQNGIQEARDAIENNNAQVQRFQSMAQHYATQVNEDVQTYTTQLQADVQTMQGVIANNQALLTKYQAETAEYQAEVATETQEQSIKMQQYQLLYNQLKAEYDQAFMIAAPKQQQERA